MPRPPKPKHVQRLHDTINVRIKTQKSVYFCQGEDVRGRKAVEGRLDPRVDPGPSAQVVDLGQEGMVPMETNMIMEEMMDDGLDDACTIA